MRSMRTAAEKAVARAGKRRAAAVDRLADTTTETRRAVTIAANAGVPQTRLAELAQVDRMTIRKWLGQ